LRASVALTAIGFVSGSAIATTDSTGTVTINSSKLSSALTGSTTFAVTGVTLTGYTYDATKNSTSSVTLKR